MKQFVKHALRLLIGFGLVASLTFNVVMYTNYKEAEFAYIEKVEEYNHLRKLTADLMRKWMEANQKNAQVCAVVDNLPLQKPLDSLVQMSPFGWRNDPMDSTVAFHSGVDFDAETGDTVYASGDAIVVKEGLMFGYGRILILQHYPGIQSMYAHLSGTLVDEGDSVYCGEPIGLVGMSGKATGSHLHYEIMIEGEKVDPTTIMQEQ